MSHRKALAASPHLWRALAAAIATSDKTTAEVMNEGLNPTQQLTGGELKFRAMVDDLMVMEKHIEPRMVINCPNSSKARSLRRMFYNWQKNLKEFEQKFISNFEYKVQGRTITVQRKDSWQPIEVSGDSNVSDSKSVPTGSN